MNVHVWRNESSQGKSYLFEIGTIICENIWHINQFVLIKNQKGFKIIIHDYKIHIYEYESCIILYIAV